MAEGLLPRIFVPLIQTFITSYLSTTPSLTLVAATKDKYSCPSSISMDAAFSTFAGVAVVRKRRENLCVAPLAYPGWGGGAA